MFTRLQNPTRDQAETHSVKQGTKSKDLKRSRDKGWMKNLGHSPIISKSLILPRYAPTKQQLIQQLLELPYKGVSIEKESTCEEKSAKCPSEVPEEMPQYWYINQFLKSTNSYKHRAKESRREHVPVSSRERVNEEWNVEQQQKRGKGDGNGSNVLDYFVKDLRKGDSNVVSQRHSTQSEESRRDKDTPIYSSQSSVGRKEESRIHRNQHRQVREEKNFKKVKGRDHDVSEIEQSKEGERKRKVEYGVQGVQTSFKNESKAIQCSIVKQNDEGNQYSYEYPSNSDLNLSEIKKSSLHSDGDSSSIKNSIKQIESSLEQRRSIKPTLTPKQERNEPIIASSQPVKGYTHPKQPKQHPVVTSKSNQTKDETPPASKLENGKTGEKQQREQIANIHQIDLNKKAQHRNSQKLLEDKQRKASDKDIKNKPKEIEGHQEEKGQSEPIKKSIDLLEQKRKRQKMLKIQEDTNRKLFNIFQNTNKVGSNTESAEQSSAVNSKLTQQLSSKSEHPNPKPQPKLKQQTKKNPSHSNRSELSVSDMQSFHTKDVSNRVFQDFPIYNEGEGQNQSSSQGSDLDSFENYESSSEGTDRQRYVLEQVKEQEENEDSLAQSKVHNFAKKESKPKLLSNRMEIPYSSKIEEQKSNEGSVEQSIVQQYSIPSDSKKNSGVSNSQKLPKSEVSMKQSNPDLGDESSFDLQHFIIKDIKNNVDDLKSKMSNQAFESQKNEVLNVFQEFNKKVECRDLKKDIDSLRNKISTSNNL